MTLHNRHSSTARRAANGCAGASKREIVDELETASLELDCLIGDMRAKSRTAGSLELVEERVKQICDRMLVAVRGPSAGIMQGQA